MCSIYERLKEKQRTHVQHRESDRDNNWNIEVRGSICPPSIMPIDKYDISNKTIIENMARQLQVIYEELSIDNADLKKKGINGIIECLERQPCSVNDIKNPLWLAVWQHTKHSKTNP